MSHTPTNTCFRERVARQVNGYSYEVNRLSDKVLTREIDKCAASWWEYGDPATDSFFWYQALLAESENRTKGAQQR